MVCGFTAYNFVWISPRKDRPAQFLPRLDSYYLNTRMLRCLFLVSFKRKNVVISLIRTT